ncbi:hypothetical protein BDW02DRAFT_624136 [Decorospora gaudefroyi]|uniref:Uncharacterized protein n=1 Tax=Decorospora gaudefroyi TaxID=184978 RepID=A0A6A5KJJ4_9PLEO|nr:hypothetical protein BDW02DRAFT_624136 [Decorospora gaudefroyi]
MGFLFNFGNDWQTPPGRQHRFIDSIRAAVLEYRIQSASHFCIPIEISQAIHSENPDRLADITPDFLISVGFYHFGRGPVIRVCRPTSRKRPRRTLRVLTGDIEVLEGSCFVPLASFLDAHFHLFGLPVGPDVMFKWWNKNGKVFNWAGLPTELKERVVHFCMEGRPGNFTFFPPRPRGKYRPRTKKRAPEITNQLGEWSSLLHVSHQVRAITLRLCLIGSSHVAGSNGLCIEAHTSCALKDSIRRLRKLYQMIEPNAVPVDDKTLALAKTYKQYPRIYPHLHQYATVLHGIRKMSIQMDFLSYLHFFKITTAGFAQYWKPRDVDYEVFEQLPHLNELVLHLPDARARLEDKFPRSGPRLFYGDPFNCPRILHRLIYEQAADVLAPYKGVTMKGFVDDSEESRFMALRRTAIEALRFTDEDLEELYREDGGGIELEESVVPGVKIGERGDGSVDTEPWAEVVQHGFWPPKCRCEVLCRRVLFPV